MKKCSYYYKKHKNFIKYTAVGIVVSIINVALLYFLIDILKIPTVISGTVVVGITFLLKYFLYNWTGFASK